MFEHPIFAPLFRSNNFPASFALHSIAYSRRFPDHDLDLCGTGCYLSPNECSPQASSFWSLFPLPGHFARPSGIRSREWNHSKSDYDMRWAFKVLDHSSSRVVVASRSDFSTRERNRRENAIRQESVLPIDIEAEFSNGEWYLKSLYATRSGISCWRVNAKLVCQVMDVLHVVQI